MSRLNNFIPYKIVKINQAFYCFFSYFVIFFNFFLLSLSTIWSTESFFDCFLHFFWFLTYFITLISFFLFCFGALIFFFFWWFWWLYFCFNFYLYFCFSLFCFWRNNLQFFSFFLLNTCPWLISSTLPIFFLFLILLFLFSLSSLLSITIIFFVFLSNNICIRVCVVFNTPFIIVWWYLFNNFIYNWLSFYDFICFIYFYFSIKAWKLFQKFFITYYICRFIF